MTLRTAVQAIARHENLNFLLTNRIPRRWITLFVGWFSKIEAPWVREPSIAIWRLFSNLDLSEAKRTDFISMHDCFTRELKSGARPVAADPGVITSPCDAIIGACGSVRDAQALQAKGAWYPLIDLLHDQDLVDRYRDGLFVTLRLTASMYHRFHAPYACKVRRLIYISGDTWNVNPIALQRITHLFCKNERAIIPCELSESGAVITLVPVAAILVASIRLHFANILLHLNYRGANRVDCDTTLAKGQEMGWFEHGSTIILFAPSGFSLCESIIFGRNVKMGEPLLRLPPGVI